MGGGPKTPLDGAADAVPVGDDGFVVVEEEQEASHANLPTTKAGSAQAAPTRIPPPASPPPRYGCGVLKDDVLLYARRSVVNL